MTHLRYMIHAGTGIALIGNGWDLSAPSDPWWYTLIAFVLVIVGLAFIDRGAVKWEYDRTHPYQWECNIGECKGRGIGVGTSEKDLRDSYRDDHMRTKHLMEP